MRLNEILDRMNDAALIERAMSNEGIPEVEILLYLCSRGLISCIKEEVNNYVLLIKEDSPNTLIIGLRMTPQVKHLDLNTTELILSVFDEESLSFIKSMRERAALTFTSLKSKAGQRGGKK